MVALLINYDCHNYSDRIDFVLFCFYIVVDFACSRVTNAPHDSPPLRPQGNYRRTHGADCVDPNGANVLEGL